MQTQAWEPSLKRLTEQGVCVTMFTRIRLDFLMGTFTLMVITLLDFCMQTAASLFTF